MKKLLISALIAFLPGLVLAQAKPAETKTPAKSAATNTAKSPTKAVAAKHAKNAASKKVTVAKAQPNSSRVQLRSVTGQVASGLVAAEAALSPAELDIAQRVYVGRIACELGAYVNVQADPAAPGHFSIEGKGFKYRMTPVVTSTGAVRLEDATGGAVWLQIANKSMLMNQKIGQRLADECMSSEQVVVAEGFKRNPPPSVLDRLPPTQ